jgi:tripartite-type tricarboxylate transporter receptor subunit TctC
VLVINQGLQKTLPYDPQKDFVPVSGMTRSPLIVIVKGDSALESVQQLVARAKTLRNLMPMGSAGNGTIPHLAGTYFNQQAGISALHVPFNGVAPALLSLLSGDTIYMFDTLSTSIENIKAGKVKGLGIASDKRFSGLPEIATLAEQGYVVQASSWFGLVAPAKTPQATVVAMNQAINSILTAVDFSNKMAAMGIETMPGSVDQFAAFIEAERARWLPEVARLNLSAE